MMHERSIRFRLAVLSLGLVVAAFHGALLGVAHAQTPVSDVNSAALIGPFDMTAGHQTYITVHAPNGITPSSGLAQVITHWVFWDESCTHLADAQICLTLDDSIVVDPSNIMAIGPANEKFSSSLDVTGYRGMFTVTAYEADSRCRDAGDMGYTVVPDAINGTFTIANTITNASFGDRAQSLETNDEGQVVVPTEMFSFLDLPFFQPDTLEDSSVILLTVVNGFGDFPNEPGPPQGRVVIGARARVCDNQEVCLSLPDVTFPCALFSSLIPGRGNLLPETVHPASGGFLRFSSPRFVEPINAPIVGDNLWIYSWQSAALGPFGTGSRGTYGDRAEPTATASPTSTPAPTPTLPQATSTPALSPTPGLTPSASPTATQGAATPTPTGVASPTPTPDLTPTPGLPTGTPAPTQQGATPAPTASLFSPNPGDTPTATP